MTHTPTEWLAFLSLGASGYAAVSAPYFLLVDADHFAWPRLDLRPVLETPAGDRLLVEVVNAKAAVKAAVRDAALWVAALLMLLTAASKEGALR